MKRLLMLLLLLACCVGCGRRSRPVVNVQPAVFLPQLPPSSLQGEELYAYMSAHYWDRFNFSDTLFLRRVDTLQMLDAYATYISRYVRPDDLAPIDSLMHKASASRPMLEYFWMLAERVLYDPNSPLRNDELYIPVLQAVAGSVWFDQWERIAPEHDLRLAMQNRVGQPANDFRYTLASGTTRMLYGLDVDYTLLYLGNPDCPMCRQLTADLTASPLLNQMVERGELKVLMLYVDDDLEAWQKHRDEIPASWIDAYDKGCVVREQELYDTKAIPALYLLDRQKRVLLKDSTSVPDVEEVIDKEA